MAQVSTTKHPAHAKIWQNVQPGDFIDGYRVDSTLTPRQALQVAFDMPAWADHLMRLRNLLLKPFGLKTENFSDQSDTLFPITYEDDTQIIIGADDSHLNFRISVLRLDHEVHMATWVQCHNSFGRMYLAAVMPFHCLIVRTAMRRIGQTSMDHLKRRVT